MKWILILILIVVIMLIAKSLSEQYLDRFNFYYNLNQFLTKFKLNLAFRQTKVLDFLDSTNSKKQFRIFIESYKEYLKTNKLDLSKIKILEDSERQELEDIIVNIGRLDSKNEINQVESFLLSTSEKLQQAEKTKNKFCPMIIKLSFLFAVALAILLI